MKKLFKSAAALTLAAALSLSLCACGSSGASSQTPSAGQAAVEEAQTEYIYKPVYSSPDNGGEAIYDPIFKDNGFYSIQTVKVGERELKEWETLDYEGQLDVYENRMVFFTFDGTRTELSDYEPLRLPSQDPNAEEETLITAYNTGISFTESGKIIEILNLYESWYDGPENMRDSENSWQYNSYVEDYYIRVLDNTGKVESCAKIEKPEDAGYFNIYNFRAAKDDTIVFLCDDRIYSLGTDGMIKNSVQISGWADDIFVARDGSLAVKVYDEGTKLYVLDPDTLEFTKTYKAPDGYGLRNGAGDYDCFYTNGANLCGYCFETESSEIILSWINCDINDDELTGYTILPDGSVFGVTNNWSEADVKTEFVTISRVPYDPAAKKESLVFACSGLDWGVKRAIIAFNRSHENVRIDVKDYSVYNTGEEYGVGADKLTTELLAGQLPDIIALNGMPYKQLASKGLLEDLYPYIDADSELSRDDFFTNILDAAGVNGKLYTTISSFALRTVMGAKSVVGDGSSWTFEDFNNALASMPDGCTPFEIYTTQESILSTLVALNFSELVDWTTGKCNFDTDAFTDMLKFAALFPAEFDWENYEWSEDDSAQKRISSGMQMLMEAYVSSFDDLAYNAMPFGGAENAAYVGYPSADSDGHMVSIDLGYAMTAACKDKQAAWEFLRSFFTADYQREGYGIPINKTVYNEKIEDASTPIYRTDENGNKVLDENGEPIMEVRWGFIDETGNEFNFYFTPKDVCDSLTSIIENVHKVWNYDDSINGIVLELSKTFFAGQKTAEEAAKLIQSKAMIYVNEQR